MPTIDPCLGCPYRFSVAVGPRGNPASRIVLVCEAPGTTEIIEEEPFRGRAGDVLWRAVSEARLLEGDLFITNAVACRPPHGPPAARAIAACHGRLVRDIEAHPRAVVVALVYVRHYRSLRALDQREVAAWRLPVLVARLAEGIAEERASLLALVQRELDLPPPTA